MRLELPSLRRSPPPGLWLPSRRIITPYRRRPGLRFADWTRVRTNTSTQTASGTATNTVTLTNAATQGDGLMGGILLNANVNLLTAVDNNNFAYTVVQPIGSTSLGTAGYFGFPPTPPTSITFTTDVASSVFWCKIEEFTPPTGATAFSLDGAQTNNDTPNTELTFGAVANYQIFNNDVLQYACTFAQGNYTTGAGFSAGDGSGTGFVSEFKIVNGPINNATCAFVGTATAWTISFGIAPIARGKWSWETDSCGTASTGSTTTTAFSVSLPKVVPNPGFAWAIYAAGNVGTNFVSAVDDQNNPWVEVNTAGNFETLLVPNTATKLLTNQPKTLTVTLSAASGSGWAAFITGMRIPPNLLSLASDGSVQTSTSSGTGTDTSPTLTTTKANDLLLGLIGASGLGVFANNGYTNVLGQVGNFAQAWRFQQEGAGATTISSTHATPSDNHMVLAAFAPTFSGAGGRNRAYIYH